MAEKLGVSGRSVSKLENGIYMSDMSLYKDICNILDISLVEFISDETKVEKIQSSECDESINSIIETSTKSNNLFKKYYGFMYWYQLFLVPFFIVLIIMGYHCYLYQLF